MKLYGCRVSSAAIDDHVTSRCVVSTCNGVTLWHQLRQSQLTHVDGRRLRLQGDQQVVRTVGRRYARLPAVNQTPTANQNTRHKHMKKHKNNKITDIEKKY